MAITDWPEGERPRERLLAHGPEALSDAELLPLDSAPRAWYAVISYKPAPRLPSRPPPPEVPGESVFSRPRPPSAVSGFPDFGFLEETRSLPGISLTRPVSIAA